MAFPFSVHAKERSACRGMDWIMKLKLKCKQIMISMITGIIMKRTNFQSFEKVHNILYQI